MTRRLVSYDVESTEDIQDDLSETSYLVSDALHKLSVFQKTLTRVKSALPKNLTTYTDLQAKQLTMLYETYADITRRLQTACCDKTVSPEALISAEEHITETRMFLRTHQHILASVVTMSDWQSPSFSHSIYSQAGRQTNTIYETINDYKRDQHQDANRYERMFVKQYIDTLNTLSVKAYATSSGMAAFSTIISFILFETDKTRPIVMGASSYFENKMLLYKAFPGRIIEVDETDTKKILSIIALQKPIAIFLDSITNAPTLPIPDIHNILQYMKKIIKEETYLVIDNTGLPIFFQPLRGVPTGFKHLRFLVFESLNKYHQFGMDRVTGGIVWGYGKGIERIFDYREHLGTNIPDASTMALPTPNRTILTNRLKRHERNARYLAKELQSWIDVHPRAPIASIRYPGFPSNYKSLQTEAHPYNGSYLVVELKKRYQSVSQYKKLIRIIMKNAGKKRVDLISGTSFGLNTTRIYLTAVRTDITQPFLRVSVGVENKKKIVQICDIILTSFAQF